MKWIILFFSILLPNTAIECQTSLPPNNPNITVDTVNNFIIEWHNDTLKIKSKNNTFIDKIWIYNQRGTLIHYSQDKSKLYNYPLKNLNSKSLVITIQANGVLSSKRVYPNHP